jgi:hypothetical protein
MLRLKNGFLVVATAFFASGLSCPVFAEEKETPKVYLENLKENFDFNGSVKTFFSYSGIPTSNINWNGNDFRIANFRADDKNINSAFNAGIKGALNFGKTFKNDAGKNVLKVSAGLEVDLINDEFDAKTENKFKLASAKCVLFDHLKVGYDSLFIAGAKTVMIGGMFKPSDNFSLNFDIFRDLPLVDLGNKSSKGLWKKVETGEGENKKIEFKSAFKYSSAIPGTAIHGVYNLGNLGKVNLSLFGRPIVLKENKTKDAENKFLFGFGAKANAELHFIDKVDTLKVGGFFSMGVGDYLMKAAKTAEFIGGVDENVVALPTSFYLEDKDVKPAVLLDLSGEYAFKINPVNEVSVSLADLHYFGDFENSYVWKPKNEGAENRVINNIVTFGLGYKYSACKKMDLFTNAYGVIMNLAKGGKFDGENAKNWGWTLNFGVDCKL